MRFPVLTCPAKCLIAAFFIISVSAQSTFSQLKFSSEKSHAEIMLTKKNESTFGVSLGFGISNAFSFSEPKSSDFLGVVNMHINLGKNIFLLTGLDYVTSHEKLLTVAIIPQYRFQIDKNEADLFLGAGGRIDYPLGGGPIGGGADVSLQIQYNMKSHLSPGLQVNYLIGGSSPGYALMHISLYLKFNL